MNRHTVWEMVAEAKKGRSIILTTHFMDEAGVLSDRIGIINKGRLVAGGSPLFLKQSLGAGYTLSYLCAQQAQQQQDLAPAAVKEQVLITSPAATFQYDVRTEHGEAHHWSIPHGAEKTFPALLRLLAAAGCSGVSLELTTLEEVFLKTGSEEAEPPEPAKGKSVPLYHGDGAVGVVSSSATAGTKKPNAESESATAVAKDAGSVALPVEPETVEASLHAVWVNTGAARRAVSRWARIAAAARAIGVPKLRSPSFLVFVVIMPMLYLIAGLVVGRLLSSGAEDIIVSAPLLVSPAAVLQAPQTLPIATVYDGTGVPAGGAVLPPGVQYTSQVPPSAAAFVSNASVYYLGGFLANQTLMFNGSSTFSCPVLMSLAANASLSRAAGEQRVGIATTIQPLPYKATGKLVATLIATPTLVSYGFMSISFLVLDLVVLRESELFGLFRTLGVSRVNVFLGVTLQAWVTVLLPFLLVAVVVGLATQSALLGSAGRWLAFLVAALLYGCATTPLSMLFEPVLPSWKAAKDWWWLISMLYNLVPWLVYSIAFQPPLPPGSSAQVVADALCVFPSFAFSRVMAALLSTVFLPDQLVSWELVWGWNSALRVSYSIVLLAVMSAVLWTLLVLRVHRASRWASGSVAPDAPPAGGEDADVLAERERSLRDGQGINVRDLVRHFDLSSWLDRALPRSWRRGQTAERVKRAVKGLSVGIKPAETYVLLGPNGSGKTVALKCLTLEMAPSGGAIALGGFETPHECFAAARLGYCPQRDSLLPGVSVERHCQLAATMRGLDLDDPEHRAHVVTVQRKLGLHRHLAKVPDQLSGGYKRKLCLAIAIIGFPDAVVADEPSTGVDPASRHELWSVLRLERPVPGVALPAMLISTHYMDEAEALATRIGVMVDGKLRTTGSLGRLKDKHCQSNFLEATFNDSAGGEADARLVAFLGEKGYQPRLVQSLMQTAKIELPYTAHESGAESLARLFDLVESNKDALGIKYYHLAPQSLEGIFIQLSEKTFEVTSVPPSVSDAPSVTTTSPNT